MKLKLDQQTRLKAAFCLIAKLPRYVLSSSLVHYLVKKQSLLYLNNEDGKANSQPPVQFYAFKQATPESPAKYWTCLLKTSLSAWMFPIVQVMVNSMGGQDVSVGFWLQPVTHQKAERLKRRALLRGAAPREDEACRLPSQDQERGALQVHMSKRGQKGLMYSLHSLYSLPLRAFESLGSSRPGASWWITRCQAMR